MKIAAVLHDVRSVHNVGSIFRTADAAGVRKLWLCGITPTPFDRFGKVRPDFAKVALGAERSIAWEYAAETAAAIAALTRDGYRIFAVEQAPGSVPYDRVRPASRPPRVRGSAKVPREPKLALLMGNEVEGVPPALLALADRVIEIPMAGKKESLNVAVAFGVVAYGLQFGKMKS